MKKGYESGKYYIITATMKNGDKLETRRNGFLQMQNAIQNILEDKDVTKFSVEEKIQ